MGQEAVPVVLDVRKQTSQPPSAHPVAWSTSDRIEFFESIPRGVQINLRTFLKTGESECLSLCDETFHFYFHYACRWTGCSSLLHACVTWHIHHVCNALLPGPQVCDCRNTLDVELKKLNDNICVCQSVTSTTRSPQYLVLFTAPEVRGSPRKISVFDLCTSNIFSVLTTKGKEMGEGYAVCSLHAENVPYVVISGGYGKSARKLYRYDVVRDKWDTKIDLNNSRSGHVMCSCLGQIFLIGGRKSAVVEVCNVKTKECAEIGVLPVGVHNMAHTVLGDKIYLFGGENDNGNVSAVQCIDTKNKTITRLKDLPCECSGGQAVVYNKAIYIATHQGHMIRYDIVSDSSELCSHQPFCRKYFAMFVRDNNIYVLGGVRTDSEERHSCVLCKYVPQSDQWIKAATFTKSVPIYASCIVQYPKSCPIIPFSSSL